MVKEDFTMSCHFRSCEEDFVCIFIRGYRVVHNEERDIWEKLSATNFKINDCLDT